MNLAPFSFFNAICSDPALLALSIGRKDGGELKDTARNILSGREFVVHIANSTQASNLTTTSSSLDYGESELALTQLELTPFEGCSLPRLSDCDIAFQCTLYEHHLIGPNQQAIIYAQVKQLFASDKITHVDGKRVSINANDIDPLSRLGAAEYAGITESFSIKRPK